MKGDVHDFSSVEFISLLLRGHCEISQTISALRESRNFPLSLDL
jgi:hypothetical protein